MATRPLTAAGGGAGAAQAASPRASEAARPAPNTGARIEVQGLSHTYPSSSRDRSPVMALDSVELTVEAGEFFSLIGPSGCGKSTLLRIMAGLVKPARGTVRFTVGTDTVDELPGGQVGFVFQDSVLLPWKNVWENVIFPLRILGALTPESEARARALLELAKLTGFEKSLPKELSGGMRQRVSIVRALAHDPQMLLMDEPFGALDALTRDRLNLELLRIWEERPKTIVFVTHSIEEAVLLSDRVAVLSERPGRVVEVLRVELPRPRSMEMRDLPEFRTYVRQLRGLLG